MKKAIEIYQETKKEVLDNGNQSLENIALLAIEKTQKEMFYFIYKEAEKKENENLSLIDFFDKLDRNLQFS